MEKYKTDEIQCAQRGVYTLTASQGGRTVKSCFADIAVNHICCGKPFCHKT